LLGVDEGVLVLDRDRVQAAVLAKCADKVPPPGRVVATASGGPYTLISSSAVSGTIYTDSTVQSGNTYYYTVTAVDGAGGESTFSNEAVAAIPVP